MTGWDKFWLALQSMLVMLWAITASVNVHSFGPLWLSVVAAIVITTNVLLRAWRVI